ncbi:MAG: S26 family signal peptidase [Methanomassiliicoccaceae archaeon]|nr:S26 family signal peptidase [Methanomassiliicoccaceae archaeon]
MKKETRNIVIAATILVVLIAVGYAGISAYSGTSPQFYTVESGSMMHTHDSSKIGVIDTGDMVIVRDPSKMNITSYIEAHESGYTKFSDYGDVILYKDGTGRTIIHRAILHIEYLGSNEWFVFGLKEYTGEWSCGPFNKNNYDNEPLSGTITFLNFGFKDKTVDINLGDTRFTRAGGGEVDVGTKGYVAMGDANNPNYDKVFVKEDMVVAIATHEIPWVGVVKLYVTGTNVDRIPPNSLPLLIGVMVGIIVTLVVIGLVYDRHQNRKKDHDEE